MAQLKRLRYGVFDFKQLRNEDKYLIDTWRMRTPPLGADSEICAGRKGEKTHPRHTVAPHRDASKRLRDDKGGGGKSDIKN